MLATVATVLLVHGGGWGPVPSPLHNPHFRHEVVVQYRPGRAGMRDLTRAYDRAAKPACVYGESAGGQLALMLATRRHPACVIAAAAPADLTTTFGPVRDAAIRTFGATHLRKWSPALHTLHTKVLSVWACNDPLVNMTALPGRSITLPAGDSSWIHSSVDAAALARAKRAMLRFVRHATR